MKKRFVIMMSKLNHINLEIELIDVENIFKKLNLVFKPKNINYYRRAFVHKSYIKKNNELIYNIDKNVLSLQDNSQELYEFVGDSVFNKCVCIYLYHRYKEHDLNEGNLTRLKQRIIDCRSIAKMSRFLNLQKFCIISSFVEKTSGRNTDKLMEDTFEAFIFALFLDLGEKECNEFIISVIENVIDFAQINFEDINHKHQLLEFFQKHWKLTPFYKKIYDIGSPHNKTYKMAALDIFENIIGEDLSQTKKDAEQGASKKALVFLNQLFNNNNRIYFNSFNVVEIGNNCCIDNNENIKYIFEIFLRKNNFFKIDFSFEKNGKINEKSLFICCDVDKNKIYKDFLTNSARDYLEKYYFYVD